MAGPTNKSWRPTREDPLAALAFAAEMMRDEQYVAAHKAVT